MITTPVDLQLTGLGITPAYNTTFISHQFLWAQQSGKTHY